jgi:hypothetical protein
MTEDTEQVIAAFLLCGITKWGSRGTDEPDRPGEGDAEGDDRPGRATAARYRAILFAQPHEAEVIWPGKASELTNLRREERCVLIRSC